MGGSFRTSGGGGEGGHERRNLRGDVRCSVLQCVAVFGEAGEHQR